jgi:hypothetical protein
MGRVTPDLGCHASPTIQDIAHMQRQFPCFAVFKHLEGSSASPSCHEAIRSSRRDALDGRSSWRVLFNQGKHLLGDAAALG